MNARHSFVSATLAELQRRKVPRAVTGYAVAVFVLLQLMDAAVEPLLLPQWLQTLIVVSLLLGFPLVFFAAWYFDVQGGRIRRTRPAGLLSRIQSALLFGLTMIAVSGIAWVFFQYYSHALEPSPVRPATAQQASLAPENSIAVLPFTDLSEKSDQGALADGMAEEILNLLAQVDGLNVAARTSSFAARDQLADVREIGRLLNVRTVLEGSVRASGDRIRLTAQLIDAEDGYHIWSEVFDRKMTDLLTLQEEVATRIAAALVESFNGLEVRPAARTQSVAAAQAYRTGRLHWWRRTPGELHRAIESFTRALEHDADFAPAYAAMADSWLLLGLYGNVAMVEAIEIAQPMIEKALELDPQSAEGFAALGLARWQVRQMDAAESALRRSVELNEDYIPAQLWLGGLLGEMGRLPEQRLVLQGAIQRDPLNELLLINLVNNLFTQGDWESGRAMMARQLALRPDSTMLLRSMSMMEMESGNLVEAWSLANRAYQLEPENPEDIATLARVWLMLGEWQEAEGLVLRGLEHSERNAGLLGTRWLTLLVSQRYESARAMVREQREEFGTATPGVMQRYLDYQLGMIALLQGDAAEAAGLLMSAAGEDDGFAFKGQDLMALTLGALAARRHGALEQAEKLLGRAERKIRRARLNGVDNANIYYNEAALLALRGDKNRSLEKLNAAYQKGFREQWLLEIDGRLDPLRDLPEFQAVQQHVRDDVRLALSEIRSLAPAVAQL